MEPEVHIIEKYFQTILGCLTMTNVKCAGGKEIDLLAMNPKTSDRYHVESRVSTTFKLKGTATFNKKTGACHKNGLDYFHKEKFEHEAVKKKISEYFGNNDYKKILVVWSMEDISLADFALKKYGFWVCYIDEMINDLLVKGNIRGSRDDVLRVIELVSVLQKTFVKSRRLGGRVSKEEMEEESRLPQFPRDWSANYENKT